MMLSAGWEEILIVSIAGSIKYLSTIFLEASFPQALSVLE